MQTFKLSNSQSASRRFKFSQRVIKTMRLYKLKGWKMAFTEQKIEISPEFLLILEMLVLYLNTLIMGYKLYSQYFKYS